MKEPTNCKSNYWLQTIKMNSASIVLRDKILDVTNSAGYMTRPPWVLLSELDQFNSSPKSDLTVSRELFSSLINIPSSDNIKSLNLMP